MSKMPDKYDEVARQIKQSGDGYGLISQERIAEILRSAFPPPAEDARRLREKIMELYRTPFITLDWKKITDAKIESFAQLRVEPWREALNWVTHLLCGQGKRGGAPESGEIEEATAEAHALLSDSPAKEAR